MGTQSSWDLASLLTYAAPVLLVLMCGISLARALWAPPDLHRHACCGGCRHAVSDILQGRCPECGGYYSKVGISTPLMAVRLRGSLPLALLAWTALIVVAFQFAHGWLQKRAWTTYTTGIAAARSAAKQAETYSTEFTPWEAPSFDTSPAPNSSVNYRISVDLNTVNGGGEVESGSCMMKLRVSGQPEWASLKIDIPSGRYTMKDNEGKVLGEGTVTDKGVARQWFQAVGLDPDMPFLRRGIEDAEELTHFAKNDPGAIKNRGHRFTRNEDGALQTHGGSSSSGPIGGFPGAPLMGPPAATARELGMTGGVFGLVYLVGACAITWRFVRLVRTVPLRAST